MDWHVLAIMGAVVVIALLLAWEPAQAETQVCVPRKAQVEHLADKYGETLSWRGLTETGQLVEKYQNPDGTSWTLVIGDRHQICFMQAGKLWREVEQPVQEGEPL